MKRDPKLGWGVTALFDMQARAGDYDGALNTLAIARDNGHVEPSVALRRRAILLTAEARDAESADPDKALRLANEALRLAPSLVPAAEIAGRVLASKGESRPASRLIVRTWKLSPHPDLALVYAFARAGNSPRERLKRVKYLASLTPGDIEGPIAVANAAIEAHEWDEARSALAPYLDGRPPARVCTLMARIEAGELGDKGREREWLARALRAPRDRAWIADGYISDRWLPVSPVTGAVDGFEWKAPVDAIGRGDDTLVIEERPATVAVVSAAAARSTAVRSPGARRGDRCEQGERGSACARGQDAACAAAAAGAAGAEAEARDLRAGAPARRSRRGASRDRREPEFARAPAHRPIPLTKSGAGGALLARSRYCR